MNVQRLSKRFLYAIAVCAVTLGHCAIPASGQDLRYIGVHADRGMSDAVMVGDVPLVHTGQVLPLNAHGEVIAADIASQTNSVLDNLEIAITAAGGNSDQLVKLNIYVTDQADVASVEGMLAKYFADDRNPAVSFVMTRLPHADARVAMDAVAVGQSVRAVTLHASDRLYHPDSSHAATSPPGTRIYVAGQAEKGATLAEATRQTLESLRKTLHHLGRREADIVQLKAFLSPMSDVKVVQAELAAFFGKLPVPPASFVEWKSPLIEIELIAWGGDHNSGPVVEYLTPPGMNASPVYSRVTRINSTPSIYTSGLLDADTADAAGETKSIFAQLERIVREGNSDLKHLAKATYYCSTDDASQQLNQLRPQYYDPARPPSASKAMVAGAGRTEAGLTLDMIAVPAWDNAIAEYGPTERGRGLSAEQVQEGWLSLFDGSSSFGWQDARMDDQGLSGGMTTTKFGPAIAKIEVAVPGSITKGKMTFQLDQIQTITLPDTTDSIQLSDTIRVKSFHIRPLKLESIFDGQELKDWQRIDHQSLAADKRPQWQVANGLLQATGGPGALEYKTRQFGNFVLQTECRSTIRHANGGIFFRAIPGDFMNGYEAQIYNRALDGDPSRPARYSTGALDDRQMARRLVSRDGEFFVMTVVASENHIATWVNGEQMTDWSDLRPAHENPREGLRISPGSIQLQAHDSGTAIEFRSIRIGDLRGPK